MCVQSKVVEELLHFQNLSSDTLRALFDRVDQDKSPPPVLLLAASRAVVRGDCYRSFHRSHLPVDHRGVNSD